MTNARASIRDFLGERPERGPGACSTILLFGELLADCFPDREIPGGAPFNVAHHLRGLAGERGPTPILVTRIGKDERGERLLEACRAAGLAIDGIQRDFLHASGRVDVIVDPADGRHHFEIPPDQAWDHIHADVARMVALARRPGLIYFGTLAQRAASRQALRYLLVDSQAAGFLDVNLRPPWLRKDVLRWSLGRAETVKLNEEELSRIAELLGLGAGTPDQLGERLTHTFDIRRLLVTRGEHGAWLLDTDHGRLETGTGTDAIEVVDSVGAGDAFAAVFLLGLSLDWPAELALERAHHFAGAICGLRGAVPADAAFYAPFRSAWRLTEETGT